MYLCSRFLGLKIAKKERCRSGRSGRSRKPLTLFGGPRVRIPVSPQFYTEFQLIAIGIPQIFPDFGLSQLVFLITISPFLHISKNRQGRDRPAGRTAVCIVFSSFSLLTITGGTHQTGGKWLHFPCQLPGYVRGRLAVAVKTVGNGYMFSAVVYLMHPRIGKLSLTA